MLDKVMVYLGAAKTRRITLQENTFSDNSNNSLVDQNYAKFEKLMKIGYTRRIIYKL
jgi:hypothetical protein